MISVTKSPSELLQSSAGCMKNLLILGTCLIIQMSCNQLSFEEKLIMKSLNRTVDLSMFEIAHHSDTIYSFEAFRNEFSFLYLVYLQDGCRPCYQEYVTWQKEMNKLSLTKDFSVLFIINSTSYNSFISELMYYEPDFDLSSERFFIAMDPEQNFIERNSDIDPRVIHRSIMINDANKILLIGKPFASRQMAELFQNSILE